MKVRSRVLLYVMLALGLATGVQAQSQATTGVIEGTLLDDSGAAVPGATVSIRNTATNFERALQTDAEGRFRGLLLPLPALDLILRPRLCQHLPPLLCCCPYPGRRRVVLCRTM